LAEEATLRDICTAWQSLAATCEPHQSGFEEAVNCKCESGSTIDVEIRPIIASPIRVAVRGRRLEDVIRGPRVFELRRSRPHRLDDKPLAVAMHVRLIAGQFELDRDPNRPDCGRCGKA